MHGPPTVETHQLLLRAPQPADVDPLFEIQGNVDAMRHTSWTVGRGASAVVGGEAQYVPTAPLRVGWPTFLTGSGSDSATILECGEALRLGQR